ncbi:hypothetical protein P280DRAFT_538339 [Massarina eburnea CBS 473.64]|uniref:Uncharacterized protein n=1 Tax=Massarina eburnea CBS 473.64 TaxID=1395130 RepID=A0A6A6RKX7_9PLEO|nr:hypothetical protein P280DRAFT_538339 [Massarina eburnea CBS 473.64]
MTRLKRKRDEPMTEDDINSHMARKKTLRRSRLHPEATARYNQIHSPLLRLPGEIRNEIYKFALGGICFLANPISNSYKTPPNFLALTRVCQQTYSETSLLPFTLNTFQGVIFNSSRSMIEDRKPRKGLTVRQTGAINTVFFGASQFHILESISYRYSRLLIASQLTSLNTIMVRHYYVRDLEIGQIYMIVSSAEKWAGRNDVEIICKCYQMITNPWRLYSFKWKSGKIREIDMWIGETVQTYREEDKGTWPKELGGEALGFPLRITKE